MNQFPLLKAEGLAKDFTIHTQGGVRIGVFAGLDLDLFAGECVALHGPSGCGKSTLLRSLYANYKPDAGRILVRHDDATVDMTRAGPRAVLAVRRTTIGYVSQFLRVIPRVSTLDVVAEPAVMAGIPREEALARAAALLERLAVPRRLWDLAPATFSGGEQQRVNIARGFVLDYPVLLLDEPTASLDAENRETVVRLMEEAKARGAGLIGIFHDAEIRARIADRLFTLPRDATMPAEATAGTADGTPRRRRAAQAETVLTNAAIVGRERIVTGGTLVVRDGIIAEIDDRPSALPQAIDLDGDYLLPGLVEMHTDNIEKHFVPRPGVMWPSSLAAVLSHDLQVAGAGITTVLDAISLGESKDKAERREILGRAVPAIAHARAEGLTKADHFLHLRCEVAHPDLLAMFEPHIDHPLVRLVSVMDHTPGQRQWWDLKKYVQYNKGEHWTEAELAERVTRLKALQDRHGPAHRRAVAAACRARGIPLASHDDATAEHIAESVADGGIIAEFPLTLDAATLARTSGMKTIMGAPNVVRGQSHSGNMSALDCARAGQLDGLSSDYVPASLLFAAFLLPERLGLALPEAVATVSDNIARMVGLSDRGRIEPGLRADLVWVTDRQHCPVVRQVWTHGVRVI